MFLEISQNSLENSCVRASFFINKRFPVNLVKFLRTSFLYNTLGDCFCTVKNYWKPLILIFFSVNFLDRKCSLIKTRKKRLEVFN